MSAPLLCPFAVLPLLLVSPPYSSLSFVFSLPSLLSFLLFPSHFPLFSSGLSCPFPSLLPSVLPSSLTSFLRTWSWQKEMLREGVSLMALSQCLRSWREGGGTFPPPHVSKLESLPSLSLVPPQRLLCDLLHLVCPQLCWLPGGTEAIHCLVTEQESCRCLTLSLPSSACCSLGHTRDGTPLLLNLSTIFCSVYPVFVSSL